MKSRPLLAWDSLVAGCIIVSAIEVPYAIGVGYRSLAVERSIDIVYAIVFGIDILMSCFVREPVRRGRRTSPSYEVRAADPASKGGRRAWFGRLPAARYLRSWRFVGDLAAAVPWSWITGSATAGALVMVRSLRLLRLLKFFRLLELSGHRSGLRRFSKLLRVHPALGRLAMSFILALWLAHVLACVLVAVHPGLDDGVAAPYANAIYEIGVILLAGEPMDGLPLGGRIVAFLGLLVSLLLVGGLIANFASMLADVDRRRLAREDMSYTGHTVLLGYDDSVPAIIDQLGSDDGMSFYAQGARPVVVIVSGRATDEIWKQIFDQCQKPDRLEIRVHKGDPSAASVLRHVGVDSAAYLIAFGEVDPGASQSEVDAQVLKSIMGVIDCLKLSLRQEGPWRPGRASRSNRLVMVAMTKSQLLASVVDAIPHGAADVGLQLRIVCPGEMMMHVLAHSTVSPALAEVYEDLVTYELEGEEPGCEIYRVDPPPEARGASFEGLAAGYRGAAAIGLVREGRLEIGAACRELGAVRPGDQVVVIAQGLHTMEWSARDRAVPDGHAEPSWLDQIDPQRVVVVGQGAAAAGLAQALEARLPVSSQVQHWSEAADRSGPPGAGVGSPPRRSKRRVGEIIAAAPDDLRGCDRVVLISDADSASQRDAEVMLGLATIMAVTAESDRPTILAEMVAPDRASIGRWFRGPIVTSMHRMLAGYVVQLLHDHVRADVFEALVGAGGEPVLSLRRLVPGASAPSGAVEYGWIREWGLRRGLLVVGYVGRDGRAVLVPRQGLLLTLADLSHVIVVGDAHAATSSKGLGY